MEDRTSKLAESASRLVMRLREAGYEAYFAGGAVRDMLMGNPPDDIDIATSASADEVISLFPRTVPVGKSFGVVIVLLDESEFQVATFRSDGAYVDGRHPQTVRFSTAREDALRRDFTINGLFYDPVDRKVMDFVEGEKDLAAGVIRCIGDADERFAEDRLRLLRAVRFAARFDFRIEQATFEALLRAAPFILSVSWERIRDEIVKMLTGPRPHLALDLMERSGLLAEVLPEVASLRGVPQPEIHHPEGDVLNHVVRLFEAMDGDYGGGAKASEAKAPSVTLAVAALLHDVGKRETTREEDGRIRASGHARAGAILAERICRRLRMANAETERIVALVEDHDKPMHAQRMRRSTLKKLLRADHFDELLELHRLDRLAGSGDLGAYELLTRFRGETSLEELRPKPLLTGNDLIDMGYTPGPGFGRALKALEEAQLEGEVKTQEEAKAWIARWWGDERS